MPGLIFDLDGTLIDSAPDLQVACNTVLAARGRPQITVHQTRQFIGRGARVLIEHAFAATGGPPDPDDPVLQDFLDTYAQALCVHTTVYPGVPETLTLLGQRAPLALCTNKPVALVPPILAALDLARFFPVVVGGGSVPTKKPHAEPLLAAMAGLSVAEAVLVGDSSADVGAARNAGIPVVAVAYGYSHGPAEALGADRLIDSFSALPDAIASLDGGHDSRC